MMATTVTIPACGWSVGTCGWLAAGLADGSITISAGTSKSGKGGLWLHWANGQQQGCLAIWDEYDLGPRTYEGGNKFDVYHGDFEVGFAGACPLTPAARQFLVDAASAWCDEANARREADEAPMPQVRIV